jgi:glycosyltransferase involved in cell wall biosynthesis
MALMSVFSKYGIEDFPYFFFIANTEPRKNTDGVLRAFALFCQQYPQYNHRLVIKGLSVEQLQKKIQACGATAAASRIHRVGYIDYADLPLIYQGAAILWFPSFLEGFGLPIVEAMAGGTPVITSQASVMPEIAGDAALYINPHQPEMLVPATVRLLEDDVLRKDLVEKGKKRAKQFTWANAVQTLLATYEKLIK